MYFEIRKKRKKRNPNSFGPLGARLEGADSPIDLAAARGKKFPFLLRARAPPGHLPSLPSSLLPPQAAGAPGAPTRAPRPRHLRPHRPFSFLSRASPTEGSCAAMHRRPRDPEPTPAIPRPASSPDRAPARTRRRARTPSAPSLPHAPAQPTDLRAPLSKT
jgi:hypothetical protein